MQLRALLKLVLPGIFCLVHAAPLAADHDGDVNIDGAVDMVDVLWGQQALHETRSLSPAQEAHGDVAADHFLVTPQGTRYQDLKPGMGEAAEPGDVVTMHFVGWLDADGRKGNIQFPP